MCGAGIFVPSVEYGEHFCNNAIRTVTFGMQGEGTVNADTMTDIALAEARAAEPKKLTWGGAAI